MVSYKFGFTLTTLTIRSVAFDNTATSLELDWLQL